MEKYSTWRDPSTSIHPFLESKNGASLLTKLFVWPLIVPLKMLVFFIFFPLFYAAAKVVQVSSRPLRFLFVGILARIVLVTVGFFWIRTSWHRINKRNKIPTVSPGAGIRRGDVIFCNKVSFVEALYLEFAFSPVFCVPPTTWDTSKDRPQGLVAVRSLTEIIFDYFNHPQITADQCQPFASVLAKVQANGTGPIVYFIEGESTNGKGILKTPSLITPGLNRRNSHIVGFKYETNSFSCYSLSGFFVSVLKLSCNVTNGLHVKYLVPEDMPPAPIEEGPVPEELADSEVDWSERVVSAIANVLYIRALSINSADKMGFLDYFHQQAAPRPKKRK